MIASKDFEEVISTMEKLPQKIVRDLVGDEKVCGVNAKVLSYSSGQCGIEPSDLDFELQKEIEKALEIEEGDEDYLFYDLLYDSLMKYGNLVKKHKNGYYQQEYY
jgi:hypothetical protein